MTAMWASPAFPALGLFALAFSSDSSHVPMSQVRQGLFAKRQSPCSGKQLRLGKNLPRFSSQMISLTSFHCSYPPVLQDREITVGPSLKFFFLAPGLDHHRSIQSPMGSS